MAQVVAPAVGTTEQNTSYIKFPYSGSEDRLKNYAYFEKLFLGDHMAAFNYRIDNAEYNKAYQKLRYVMINFAGLMSKVIADMLFSEPVIVKAGEKGDQEFLDALVYENNLHTQFYESALSNSYLGDALLKVRMGTRMDGDKKPTVIIEENTPKVYYPTLDTSNVRSAPKKHEFAWIMDIQGKKYVRKEIHEIGKIYNQLWVLKDDNTIGDQVDIKTVLGIDPEEDTKINRSLVVHIPNWKTGGRFWGISDYYDLDSLFYAINNRLTKIDNVLDKHTDPILAVPEGVLDEEGKVKREALNMIEISPEAGKEKPEYIVWNANLDAAFKQIDRLVDNFYMISEISPDVLGMGKGGAVESGRALKLKILRTIAKAARKKLYYDRAIKETLYVAQLVAKAWNLEVGGKKLTKEPVIPELEWNDGLPIDDSEQIDDEVKRIDAGLSSVKDSLMRIDGLDEKQAEAKAKEISDEKKINMPAMNLGDNPFADKTKANVGNVTK